MASGHKVDIGQYAIVPRWLLETDISSTAIRLYAVLAAMYCNRDTLQAIPSRKTLAKNIQTKSPRTVDYAVAELIAVKAMMVSGRVDGSGDATTNVYTLRTVPPEVSQLTATPVSQNPARRSSRKLRTDPESVEPESLEPSKRSESDRIKDSVPEVGKVFGADFPMRSKRKKGSRHDSHFLCHDKHCIEIGTVEKYHRRFVAAGLDPDEFDLKVWFQEALDAMGAEASPGLWLYKRFTEHLELELKSA